ncbi:unnamed protein product [Brassicogethes aeneus]|uniref:DUF4371 domain-containing protein n=1 Tax=Brassicogethes aeneus TaxID=1431903 RepID=A0A9P0FP97_BRAAE|nr:unnamed protein product [Brassicogethes aeneus]
MKSMRKESPWILAVKLSTLTFKDPILESARTRSDAKAKAVLARVEFEYDLVAAEAKYHHDCFISFLKPTNGIWHGDLYRERRGYGDQAVNDESYEDRWRYCSREKYEIECKWVYSMHAMNTVCERLEDLANVRMDTTEQHVDASDSRTLTETNFSVPDKPGTSTESLNEILQAIENEEIVTEDISYQFPDFDLKTLLQTSPLGKFYETNNSLDNLRRGRLVDIIIKHLFNYIVKHRLKYEQYNKISAKIISIFPKENIGTYFVPPIPKNKSISGKSIFAKGKLVDKCRNLLYISGESKRKKRRERDENDDPQAKKSRLTIDKETEDDQIWLKSNFEPWATVLEKWKKTYKIRQSESFTTVHEFIEKWNILKDLRSDVLINLDFDILYPDKGLYLYKNWNFFFNKLIALKQSEIQDPNIQTTVEYLNKNINEEIILGQKKLNFAQEKHLNGTKLAEAQLALFVACHSSISTVDHLGHICKSSFQGNEVTYLQIHRTKCSEIIKNVLAPYFAQRLSEDIGDLPYSLLIDESNDISVIKYLGCSIRYFSQKSSKIVCTSLGLGQLESANADGIIQCLLLILKKYNLKIENMQGLDTDNASVMTGVNNGVYKKLQTYNPTLVLIRCVCHSLQLASSYATKELPKNL